MQELLRIRTKDFLLTIRARGLKNRQQSLHNTLQQRGQSARTHELLFSPAIELLEPVRLQDSTVLALSEPLFFENTQYVLHWQFFKPVENAYIAHKTRTIAESFYFTAAENDLEPALWGQLNTRNDVGWLRLPLVYEYQGKRTELQIAFEVLPTKMLLDQDLQSMYGHLDQWLPLWRFSFLTPTGQQASKGPRRGDFPLMWIANFERLRQRFEQGLKIILQTPHKKIQARKGRLPATRLKGRINAKLAERIKEDIASQRVNQRYPSTIKTLTVDIPENRFIKSIIAMMLKRLQRLEAKVRDSEVADTEQRFSAVFIKQIQQWQRPLERALNSSFLKDIQPQLDVDLGSLVLQQKPGYSAVFHVWNELKYYLEYFARQTHVSMRSVADIYEIWCFLTIKKLLTHELGFELRSPAAARALYRGEFQMELVDGLAGAFEFERADGVRARLAHEPLFRRDGHPIRSYLLPQKPDIVLEVSIPSSSDLATEQKYFWVFDAKYRIKTESEHAEFDPDTDFDLVPDDAINQMHRYRDALIYTIRRNQSTSFGTEHLSRAVIGAFVLYPGFFDQHAGQNPYADAIASVGVGAFPLLPSVTALDDGHQWLAQFLKSQIGAISEFSQNSNEGQDLSERLYMQDPARIPLTGMQQIFYTDLLMTVSLPPESSRDESEYYQQFIAGTASWYHLPVSTFKQKFKHQHAVEEIRFLAIALKPDGTAKKIIRNIWPVISVHLKRRQDLTAEQSGRTNYDDPNALYYLFRLGPPLQLTQSIINIPDSFMASIKLTTLSHLSSVQNFAEIKGVYHELLADEPSTPTGTS